MTIPPAPQATAPVELLTQGQTTFTENGNLTVASSMLVRAGGLTIVVDPGGWNQRRAVEAALGRRDVALDEVDLVVATHLHWDHYVNFELFPRAGLVVGEAEWRRVRDGDVDYATPSTTQHLLSGWPELVLAREGTLVPGVEILDTPGHTAGHIAVQVATGEGTVVLSGDALSHQSCVATGLPELVNHSREQAAESIQKILAAAWQVVPGHGAPFLVDA